MDQTVTDTHVRRVKRSVWLTKARRALSLMLLLALTWWVALYVAPRKEKLYAAAGGGVALLFAVLLLTAVVAFIIWGLRRPTGWKFLMAFVLGGMIVAWGWDILRQVGGVSLHLFWLVPLYALLMSMNLLNQKPRFLNRLRFRRRPAS